MVEKKDAIHKKRKRRKAKAKPRVGQIISQKVVVNVGNKGYGTKRRTGTQAKRSTQPQVVYQPAPIPLQPNYSTEINDLRNEVRASRIASIAQPEQRTNPLVPRARVPEKVPVKKERKILVDEDMPFDVPLEERRPVPSLRKTLDELREIDEKRTTAVAEGKIKKRDRATKPQMEERRLMSAEDPPKKRGPKPGSKNQPKDITLEAKTTPEALSPAEDKDTPSTSHGLLDISPDFGGGKSLNEALKRLTIQEIQEAKPKPGPKLGSRNKEKTQKELEAEFLKFRGADALFRGITPFNIPAMARSASSEMVEDAGELERFTSAEGPAFA
tara:strand:+ start:756 stop:1739 length:984 start_codon:yes stop_codon:yes gene_type:complete